MFRLSRKPLAFAVILATLFGTPALAQSSDGEAALELARRLLGPWGDPAGVRFELLPRSLPQEMPDQLAIPEGFQLIGSLANYGPDGNLQHAQVVLDSQDSPTEALAMLDDTFTEAGWTVQSQGQPSGFLPEHAHLAALYCAPASFIHVNAFEREGGITDVRLEVNADLTYSPCDSESLEGRAPAQPPVPALNAPSASVLTLHGGSYLPEQASSSAIIETDLPPDELVGHLERQLEQQGWQRLEGVSAAATSTWLKVDEGREWRAVLSVIPLGVDQATYFAALAMVPQGG